MHFSNADFVTWSLIKVRYGLVTLIYRSGIDDVKPFKMSMSDQDAPQINCVKFVFLSMYFCM